MKSVSSCGDGQRNLLGESIVLVLVKGEVHQNSALVSVIRRDKHWNLLRGTCMKEPQSYMWTVCSPGSLIYCCITVILIGTIVLHPFNNM